MENVVSEAVGPVEGRSRPTDPDPDPDPESPVPWPPRNLEVTARGPARHDLTWDAPDSPGGSAITGYRIDVIHTGGQDWHTLEMDTGSTATAWSHTGIADASRLAYYRVAAINRYGVGRWSSSTEAPTEVPALPLAGVLALGALLLAGGKWRLRGPRARSADREHPPRPTGGSPLP